MGAQCRAVDPPAGGSQPLLEALDRMHRDTMAGEPPAAVFDTLLASLLPIAESPNGLVAVAAGDGLPEVYVARSLPPAPTGPGPGAVVARPASIMARAALPAWIEVLSRHGGEIVASVDDARREALPLAPELAGTDTLLAMLLRCGDDVTGTIALTGRAGGYPEGLVASIRAVAGSCAGIVRGLREAAGRQTAEAELRAAREATQTAGRAMTQFIADLSHELRAPINTLLLLAEALSEGLYGPVRPEQVATLADMSDAARFLLGLVNDALDLARLESGHLAVAPARTDVAEIGEASVRLVEPAARAKGVALVFERLPGPILAEVDPQRTQQILVNLLGNAVKFTAASGRVSLAVRREGGGVALAVSDSGIGIPADRMDVLFEPFYRGSDSAAVADGAGLGLYLVRRLAEAQGGTVEVESTVGRGSRFEVWLPDHPAGQGEAGGRPPDRGAP
jgi:signal transduction histidine kinase